MALLTASGVKIDRAEFHEFYQDDRHKVMMSHSCQDIIQSIPSRFRPEKASGYSTVFHFDISGEEGGQYTVKIIDNSCELCEGLEGSPQCVLKTKAETYIKLETGQINPQLAFMTGKVRVSNIAEMIRFSKVFRKYRAGQHTAGQEVISSRKPQHGPLLGLKILDFTRLLPGPMATMLMADMGAEVIKIEDPDNPDYIRNFAPFAGQESAFYLSLNRSKRSLAVNYNTEKGRELIYQLLKTADIFIEQFRPGVMESMGLGYHKLQKINPGIIYVSISGYGQDGPYAKKAGHDLNYIGYSGLLGTTGSKLQGPAIPGGQVADIAGGAYMAINACLSALYAREKNGEGQHVDVSMLDCVMPLTALQVAQHYAEKKNPGLEDFGLSGGRANYNVYRCADNKYLAVGTLEPKFWEPFCDALGKPEWKPRILDSEENQPILKKEVADLIISRTRQEWLDLLDHKDICVSAVLDIEDLEKNPQIQHRQMIVEQNGGILKTVGIPLKFSKTKTHISWDPPALGADTSAILQELGWDKGKIEQLVNQGIIATPS